MIPATVIAPTVPANQPVEPNLAPVQPVVDIATPTVTPSPTAEPTRVPLQVTTREWTRVPDAPTNIGYLDVRRGNLFTVQDISDGCYVRIYNNGIWSKQPATKAEADLTRMQDWTNFQSLVENAIGGPPEEYGAIVVSTDKTSFGIWAEESTHLYLKIENEWVEIPPPVGKIINFYGFVRIGNDIYTVVDIVADGESTIGLWQAQLENPSP